MSDWRITLNVGLCDLIGVLRRADGLSQKDLAEAVGISTSYMCDIENGRRTPTSPDILKRFASVLRLDVDVLYFAAGILPPDLPGKATQKQIKAAFAAMREALK